MEEVGGILNSQGWSESSLYFKSTNFSPRFNHIMAFVLYRYLSSEGLAQCLELCKEKGWKPTARNVEKVALNVSESCIKVKYIFLVLLAMQVPGMCV